MKWRPQAHWRACWCCTRGWPLGVCVHSPFLRTQTSRTAPSAPPWVSPGPQSEKSGRTLANEAGRGAGHRPETPHRDSTEPQEVINCLARTSRRTLTAQGCPEALKAGAREESTLLGWRQGREPGFTQAYSESPGRSHTRNSAIQLPFRKAGTNTMTEAHRRLLVLSNRSFLKHCLICVPGRA